VADFPSDTWVTYTMVPETHKGRAVIRRGTQVLKTVDLEESIPHNYALWVEFDGNDAWVGTSKGLGWAVGEGYYPGLKTPTEIAEARSAQELTVPQKGDEP
jgi:hypothetical protein